MQIQEAQITPTRQDQKGNTPWQHIIAKTLYRIKKNIENHKRKKPQVAYKGTKLITITSDYQWKLRRTEDSEAENSKF